MSPLFVCRMKFSFKQGDFHVNEICAEYQPKAYSFYLCIKKIDDEK